MCVSVHFPCYTPRRKRDVRRSIHSARLVAALAVVTSIVPLFGQTQRTDATAPAFEVASVKPNTSGDDSVARIPSPSGVTITNATLQMMMRWAYRVQDFQIIDGPSWLSTARFDV